MQLEGSLGCESVRGKLPRHAACCPAAAAPSRRLSRHRMTDGSRNLRCGNLVTAGTVSCSMLSSGRNARPAVPPNGQKRNSQVVYVSLVCLRCRTGAELRKAVLQTRSAALALAHECMLTTQATRILEEFEFAAGRSRGSRGSFRQQPSAICNWQAFLPATSK